MSLISMRPNICRIILFVAVALMVSSCIGTSAATRYYALSSNAIDDNTNDGFVISVGPFEIPEYLNQYNIVIRGQGTNLQVLQFDRWAEPLSFAVTSRIAVSLSREISDGYIVQFPASTNMSPDYRIRGRITHFEADKNGEVRLSLSWVILDREGNFPVSPRSINFFTSVDSSDDVAAITMAMGSLLDELALSIEEELNGIGIN